MRLAAVLVVTACSVRAPSPPASHPANAAAPIGRLAGAPPALRPGAVAYPDVPPLRTDAPVQHHHTP